MSYKNQNTFFLMESVDEIPPENLFVSHDDYAFDVNELLHYFNQGQFAHPYVFRDFTKEEIGELQCYSVLAPFFFQFKTTQSDLGCISEKFILEMKALCQYTKQKRTDSVGVEVAITEEERYSALIRFRSYYETLSSEETRLINSLALLRPDFEKFGYTDGFNSIFSLKPDSCLGDVSMLGSKMIHACQFYQQVIAGERSQDRLFVNAPMQGQVTRRDSGEENTNSIFL